MSETSARPVENARPRIGEGRIGSFICAAIGLLSIAAVLCLRFPAFLTARTAAALRYGAVAAGARGVDGDRGGPWGALDCTWRPRLRAAIGLSALLLAMLLGDLCPLRGFHSAEILPGPGLAGAGSVLHRCGIRLAGVGVPAGAARAAAAARWLATRSRLFRRQPPRDRIFLVTSTHLRMRPLPGR